MTRIEAGLVLINVEFSSSRFAYTDHDRITPKELGFGWMLKGIDADDRPFIGRNAIRRELADKTSRWATVGLVLDWADYDRVYNEAGLIPPKDETPLDYESMLYDDDGERIGYATSLMYSPDAPAPHRDGPGPAGPRRRRDAGQPRAHHQPPLRDGRGRGHPASVLQPTPKDGLTMASTDKNYDVDHRRRRAQRARQRRLPREGRPQGAHPRAPPPGRRGRDHRGAAPRLPLHVVLLRAEPAPAGHRPRARPGQARLHADPDAVVVRADGERRLPAARPGPRREHQGDHAALAARRRRDGPLRVRRRAGLPAGQAAARQGPAEHLRQVAGGPRGDRRAGQAPRRRRTRRSSTTWSGSSPAAPPTSSTTTSRATSSRATSPPRASSGPRSGRCRRAPGWCCSTTRIGEHDGHFGAWSFHKGGNGGFTQVLARAAQAFGAEIMLNAPVDSVITRNGAAVGVALEDGTELTAKTVVSALDPRRTFTQLVEPRELPGDLVENINRMRFQGTSAKVNFALDGAPRYPALGDRTDQYLGFVNIGPSMEYLERAFDDAKYGWYSQRPYIDCAIQSFVDPDMAPPGKHVMSCFVQYAPYHLKGSDWDTERESVRRHGAGHPRVVLPRLRRPGPAARGQDPARHRAHRRADRGQHLRRRVLRAADVLLPAGARAGASTARRSTATTSAARAPTPAAA